jgi:hypothetical protein
MKTPQELRNEADRIENEERERERMRQIKKKEEFEHVSGIEVYTSDDYCGLTTKNISFYFGYEVTDENDEWCFTVTKNGKKFMKIPKTKLHPEQREEPFWYLIAGIGHYLNSLN